MNSNYIENFDIIVFNYTSNVYSKFDGDQKAAFEAFINNGGHCIGYHTSAMPRVTQWEWYRENIIIGLYNPNYHGLQPGRMVKTSDPVIRNDPILTDMPEEFITNDEWYAFDQGPYFDETKVLYYIDESSLNDHVHTNLQPSQLELPVEIRHPIMWYRENAQTGSRIFYTGLVHDPAGANTDFFKLAILRGAEFVSGIDAGIPGCLDPSYAEYDPTATIHDSTMCFTVGTGGAPLQLGNKVKIRHSYAAISVECLFHGPYSVSLRNTAGETIRTSASEQNGQTAIPTESLDAGIYIVYVMRGSRIIHSELAAVK
jgi:type 1 glutamine amidotransferase